MYSGQSDLFAGRIRDDTYSSTSFIDIKPVTPIDKNLDVVEINVSSNYGCMWDLSRCLLETKMKMVDKNEKSVTDKITIVNNIGQALWRTHEVTVGNLPLGSSPGLQHLRGYVENTLGTSSDAKESYLKSEIYYKEKFGKYNSDDQDENRSLEYRYNFCKSTKEFKCVAKIHSDIFMQDKWMLSGVPINLKFYKNNDKVLCFYKEPEKEEDNLKPRIVITDVTLKMCKVVPDHKLNVDIEQRLMRNEVCRYPILETRIQKFFVPKGSDTFTFDNLFPTSQIPVLITCGFIRADALNGRYGQNSYEFRHEYVTSLGLYIDSVSHPGRPLKMDYDNEEAMDGYMSIFQADNINNNVISNGISYLDFIRGCTLYNFNLSASAGGGDKNSFPEERQGVVKIEGHMKYPPADKVVPDEQDGDKYFIVISKTPKTLLIDKNREVVIR